MSPSLQHLDATSDPFPVPPVPEKHDKIYRSTHYSEPEKLYHVNLFKLTCTCSDHENRANRFSNGDVRRVCKHILDKLKYTKLYQAYDSLTANLLHCSAYFGDDIFVRVEIANTLYVLSSSRDSNFVNVHVASPPKSGKGMVRFGYDVSRHTWQYEQPKNSRQVEQYILNILV
jgi:hypothetical protein